MYGTKCDIFSAGVIFYLILTGKQPFKGKDHKEILRSNKNCQINFGVEELKHASENGLNLLKKMLTADPESRPDADECLAHNFFNPEDKKPGESDLSMEDAELDIHDELLHYDIEFKKGLRDKKSIDSQEKIGSLALKTISNQLLTGNTETIDKLGSGDLGTPKNNTHHKTNNEKSKFSNYVGHDSGEESPSESSQVEYEIKPHNTT